mmetsp:Transcript_39042/g.81698  ORF Transcript_39042/g.81698 Transcript_39042/m.81698 type:complete len:361 (+) Transcript_39042:2-1084(+)
MSLSALDALSNNNSPNLGEEVEEQRQRQQRSSASPIPPGQPILFYDISNGQQQQRQHQRVSSETAASLRNALLFLGPSDMNDYEQILANSLQLLSRISDAKPMLYTSVDFGCEVEGSKTMQSLSIIRDRFSLLGLNILNTPKQLSMMPSEEDGSKFVLSRESADEWGNKLHTLLEGRQSSSAAITMDVRTHLAMLQANSLPRSRGVLGEERDSWAIRDTIQDGMHVDNGDGMLLEYKFNYEDPFGGCDPLMCPSAGSIIPSPMTSNCSIESQSKANDAYAAAYSTMIGSGMDPLLGVCIAASVKAIFRELGKTDGEGVFHPPSYTWSVIDQIADCSLRARGNIKQVDGLSRKMYKEFGYR